MYREQTPPHTSSLTHLSAPFTPVPSSAASFSSVSKARQSFFLSLSSPFIPSLIHPHSWIPIGAVVLEGAATGDLRLQWRRTAKRDPVACTVGVLLPETHHEAFIFWRSAAWWTHRAWWRQNASFMSNSAPREWKSGGVFGIQILTLCLCELLPAICTF